MTISSAGSIPFAFALQNQGAGLGATYKSTVSNYLATYHPGDEDFKVMPVIFANFAPMESVESFEREVDSSYHPTGLYKRYLAAAGTVTMYPRLESKIGELLFAAVGGVAATSRAADASHSKATVFEPPDDPLDFPWLTVRRYLHGQEDVDKEGEEVRDTRVTSAVFQVGAGAPALMTVGMLGISPGWNGAFSGFEDTLTASGEDIGSVPMAMEGIGPTLTEILNVSDLGDEDELEQPVIGGQVAINNTFSGSRPDNELIIGSYSPDDMVLTDQTLTFSFTIKWRNPSLYRAIMRGAAVGQAVWTPRVMRTAVEFYLGSQDYVTGGSTPYRIHFSAPEVAWQMAPIELRGGGFLTTQLTGVAQRQTAASDGFTVILENDVEYTGTAYSGSW